MKKLIGAVKKFLLVILRPVFKFLGLIDKPPTAQGRACYQSLYALENHCKRNYPDDQKLAGIVSDHHKHLDNLRIALKRRLPPPKDIEDMGGPIITPKSGGGK